VSLSEASLYISPWEEVVDKRKEEEKGWEELRRERDEGGYQRVGEYTPSHSGHFGT
jgi:hypothetical protein